MHLGNLVTLQVGIALLFQRNIKYHQEVWKNVSVEILGKVPDFKTLPGCRAFIHSRFNLCTFNTRDHFTGAKTLYCFPYDLCFIMIILFYPQSAFYPWSAVCSLHFTLSLHFTPGLQSAVCSLQSAFYTDRNVNTFVCLFVA